MESKLSTLGKFLERKRFDRSNEVGHIIQKGDFSTWLGMDSQSTYTKLCQGGTPSVETLTGIAARYPEVLELVGLTKKGGVIQWIREVAGLAAFVASLDDSELERMAGMIEERKRGANREPVRSGENASAVAVGR